MLSVTSGLKVYNSSYTDTQLNPYFCCFKDLVIGFLLYIASINDDDFMLFHPEQMDLTRNKYICIKTVC